MLNPLPSKEEAAGSSPVPPTKIAWRARRAIFIVFTLRAKGKAGSIGDRNLVLLIENQLILVRVLLGSPKKTHPELHNLEIEQFLGMLGFEKNLSKLIIIARCSEVRVDLSEPGSTFPIVFNNCISVKGAAFHSGYNMQHLRRLLRDGRLSGMKLGQTWLIDKTHV